LIEEATVDKTPVKPPSPKPTPPHPSFHKDVRRHHRTEPSHRDKLTDHHRLHGGDSSVKTTPVHGNIERTPSFPDGFGSAASLAFPIPDTSVPPPLPTYDPPPFPPPPEILPPMPESLPPVPESLPPLPGNFDFQSPFVPPPPLPTDSIFPARLPPPPLPGQGYVVPPPVSMDGMERYNSVPPRPNQVDCDSTSIARACREAAATRRADDRGRTPTDDGDGHGEGRSRMREEGRTREEGRSNSRSHRHESSRKSEPWADDRRERRHSRHHDRRHSRHRRDHRHSSRNDDTPTTSWSHRNDRLADLSPVWPDAQHQFPMSGNDLEATESLAAETAYGLDGSEAAAVISDTGRCTPVGEDEFEDTDMPVTQSLESRIEAILSQSADCAVPFLSPRSTSPTQPAVPPPLPVDDGFPGPPLPCLPDDSPLPEDTNPPLPPADFWPVPPADGPDPYAYRNIADGMRAVDGVPAVNGFGGAGDEDDRMSMSSLSSGEEKLEVNVPATAGLGDGQWPTSSELVANAAYLAEKLIQLNKIKSVIEPTPDSLADFDKILDQVVHDLRLVMCRDVRKRMIESTGFKSFEKWCDEKVQRHKVEHHDC